jgi:DNA-binding SARP family transcriptional activator
MIFMTIGIRLLGPTELLEHGRPANPGPAKRQAMLAALALEANRPVSLSRLIDAAWSDSPPRSAVANLRNHATALRKVLRDRIVSRGGGYQLRLEPDELDVDTFRRLATQGRQALAAADPVIAEPALAAALRLWRGAAGDGLPRGTALEAQLESLDEHRLLAFEDLVDARLALGRHTDVLGELREHVARQPLRERAWGQTMLALYRTGDTGAALATYRQARSTLDEHLGVEPGPELSALHKAVLDRSPELQPMGHDGAMQPTITVRPRAAANRLPVEPPRELPPDPAVLVGRTEELGFVLAATRPGDRVRTPAAVLIYGERGSGKATLAARAGHHLSTAFPDGQIYIDLNGQESATAERLVGRALRALGSPAGEVPDELDERIGRYRSWIAARRVLVIVNGASSPAQIRPLIPTAPGSALIATSRERLETLDGVPRVHLGPLPAADARALLSAYVGEERLGDTAATARLIHLCDGLPLALRIVAAQLAARPELSVRTLAERLARNRPGVLAYEDLAVRDAVTACGAPEVRYRQARPTLVA